MNLKPLEPFLTQPPLCVLGVSEGPYFWSQDILVDFKGF
jgi:hypothetical protein